MGRSDRKADCPDSPASGLEHVASVRNPWVLRLLRPSASPFDANGAIRCPLPPRREALAPGPPPLHRGCPLGLPHGPALRSEEHTSELQSLMRIPYAGFSLKKKH